MSNFHKSAGVAFALVLALSAVATYPQSLSDLTPAAQQHIRQLTNGLSPDSSLRRDLLKGAHGDGFYRLKLTPFLDNGGVNGSSSQLGAQQWLWDTGLQAKLRVLGVGLAFIWRKDLRMGHNALYFTTSK